LHRQIQGEATRDQLQQRLFEQQMEALNRNTRAIEEANRRANRPENEGIVN
jgi:hypothetical protein